jgi:hypothetical protein
MSASTMRRALLIVPVLSLLVGACKKEILLPEEVMGRIEQSVALPGGAGSLSEYDRYYAFDRPGQIKAIYLRTDQSAAGKRIWLTDPARLPISFDSGCMQVTVQYDVPGNRFLSVACNAVLEGDQEAAAR